jgi:hypothetical protein
MCLVMSRLEFWDLEHLTGHDDVGAVANDVLIGFVDDHPFLFGSRAVILQGDVAQRLVFGDGVFGLDLETSDFIPICLKPLLCGFCSILINGYDLSSFG